jgi:TRAP-type uncharacterized transport system fused permease subunit
MKRLLISLAGGVLVPLLLLAAAFLISDVMHLERFEIVSDIFFGAVAWPIRVFSSLFPPPPQCVGCFLTTKAIFASALCNVIIYMLVVYILLWCRAKLKGST